MAKFHYTYERIATFSEILKEYFNKRMLLMSFPIIALAIIALLIIVKQFGNASYAAAETPTITVAETTPIRPVPSQYIGFSIDPANLCYVVNLAQTNPAFVQLFKNMGPGTFRVGGNTDDTRGSWSTTGTASCLSSKDVNTPALVNSFFSFAQSVNYRVMWQVPLNNNNPVMDASEAAYVSTMPDLYSIEIGNEPNFYTDSSTDYQTYINNWNTIYNDYLADGGKARVTGPAVTSGNHFYETPFLKQNASKLMAITNHYYIGNESSSTTCDTLLQLSQLKSVYPYNDTVAKSNNLPWIINETNTYAPYGQQGVTNAFCSALWAAENTLIGLSNDAQGMYFHGTADYPPGNSAGKPQYYTPINEDGTPSPEYYGLLFYHAMTQAGGNQVGASIANASNIDTYAVQGSDGTLRVALINLNSTPSAITVNTANSYAAANQISLSAPSLTSLTGVTFGGTNVASDGTWTPNPQSISVNGNTTTVTVPGYTGMIIAYYGNSVNPTPTPTLNITPTATPLPTTTPTITPSLPFTQWIGNQSVETGLTGWTGKYGASNYVTVTQDTTVAHTGSASIKVSATTGAENLNSGFNDNPRWITNTTAGITYTQSAWIKPSFVGQKITMRLREWQGSTVETDKLVTLAAADTNWYQLSQTLTAAASGDSLSFAVYGNGISAGQYFNADDFSLTSPQ